MEENSRSSNWEMQGYDKPICPSQYTHHVFVLLTRPYVPKEGL